MNTRLSTDHDFSTLSGQIEVSIFYSEQGAPYCEFIPALLLKSRCDFLPDLDFIPSSASTTVMALKTSRYMMADGGYPEMYPGNEDD